MAYAGSHRALLSGSAFLPISQALFARFTTPPTQARKILINNLIVSLVSTGVWAKLDALYLFAAADAQAAGQNWVANRYNITTVNSPTFTIDRGYAGDGSTSYLRTGFNPTTASSPKFVRNSAHASLTDRTTRAAANRVEFGAVSTLFTAEIATRYTGDLGLLRINNSAAPPAFASTVSSGRFAVSRTGAAAMEAYRNGASLGTSSDTSSAPINGEFYICCLNNVNSGLPSLYSTDQIAQAGFGGALSSAEIAAMDTAISAYLTAVGA